LKAVGEKLVHKSDVGAVLLGLKDDKEVLSAGHALMRRLTAKGIQDQVEGFLLQEMVDGGHEVILGMTQDRSFGPLLMFGLGGKYVEIFKDVCFRVVPLTDIDARQMLKGIVGYPVLAGARGKKAVDLGYLAECLERLSRLVETYEEIQEIDINPLVCFPQRDRFRIVDARIRIRPA
jgi:succinyl-CoA synthetase beta subunit